MNWFKEKGDLSGDTGSIKRKGMMIVNRALEGVYIDRVGMEASSVSRTLLPERPPSVIANGPFFELACREPLVASPGQRTKHFPPSRLFSSTILSAMNS